MTAMDVWWHELNCWDARAAISFYGRTLGWTFEDIALPDGTRYHVARRGEVPVCGIRQLESDVHAGIPAHWMTYMAVDDLAAALREATLAGGRLLRAPVPLPEIGELAVVTDAADALLGLIEPAARHPLSPALHREELPMGHGLSV